MRPSRARGRLRWQGLSKGWFKRELIRLHGARCVLCGWAGGRKGLVMDHVVPWSQGGPTTLGNLQLLCKPCDVAKGSTWTP